MSILRGALAVFLIACALAFGAACSDGAAAGAGEPAYEPGNPGTAGKLFVIGGGSRPPEMMERLVEEAGLDEGGYAAVLPMASSEPGAAIQAAREDLIGGGTREVRGFDFSRGAEPDPARLDSVRAARLIYITGGDQRDFMDVVEAWPVLRQAIRDAYLSRAVIAGTSAGAAVMSEKMLTGTALQREDYYETFRTIEAGNAEIRQGLGLLKTAIIDQHFLYRSRHNRILTALLEHPELTGLGVDESTALLIDGAQAEVVGHWQVLVYRVRGGAEAVRTQRSQHAGRAVTLLGAEGLALDIYLPGQTFEIDRAEE